VAEGGQSDARVELVTLTRPITSQDHVCLIPFGYELLR
jgi:hypothetical protein